MDVKCKRCRRWLEPLEERDGSICGNCVDDLLADVRAAQVAAWYQAQPREAIPLTDDLPF